ncbi:PIN domain-containing protein [Paracoccus sp. S-4012]|nr:PIN domain-containing protein [Paracoccus sp. S-4012]
MRPTLAAYRDRILTFDTEAALIWGRLAAQIGNTTDDLKIAATALAQGATVVTRNTADFAPTGCPVLDPFAA